MSDLVLNVKQISNYPAKTNASGLENILLQSGLGAPYQSITSGALVATALENNGSMGIGYGLPNSPSPTSGQLFASNFIAPINGGFQFNTYLDAQGILRYWNTGAAADWAYDQNAGFIWRRFPDGAAGTQITFPAPLMALSQSGHLTLYFDTLTVVRDPAAPFEVATANWVRNNTVQTFNNRTGPITLTSQDVYQALQLTSPIATQDYAYTVAQQSIQNLLLTCPLVNSFNGRSGQVYLNLSDITCVFFQPGQQPISPTPPIGSNDNSIATTQWVTETIGTPTTSTNPTPPANPSDGQLWWDAIDGNLYIYYDDGTSRQWVAATAYQGSSGGSGGSGIQPSGGTMIGPLYWTATGAPTTRAAQDRDSDQLNLKDYMLPGDNDATAAFMRVIGQVQSLNRPITITIPSGSYNISLPITISLTGNMGITLKGDGSADTIINQTADADCIDVTINNFGSNNLMGGGFAISGLTLYQASPTGSSTTRTALSITGGNVATGAVGQLVLIDDLYVNQTTGSYWATGIYLGNLENIFMSRVQSYCRTTATTTHLVISGNALGGGVYTSGFNLRDCVFMNGAIGVDLRTYLQGMHFHNLNTIGTIISVNATPNAGNNLEYQFVGCYLSGKINFVPTTINLLSSIKFADTYFDSLTMQNANDTQVLFTNTPVLQIIGCTFNGTAMRLANITGLSITGANTYETTLSGNLFEGYQNGGIALSFTMSGRPPLCVGNSFLNDTTPIIDSSSGASFVATRINYIPYLWGAPGSTTNPATISAPLSAFTAQGTITVQPTSGAATLYLTAAAGQGKQLRFDTTGTGDRWVMQSTSTAESGSNAGSDFELRAYSDTGVYLDSPMLITRSNSNIALTGNVTLTNGALSGTSANQAVLLGSTTTIGTPYINMFSSGHATYDVRILAQGGTGATDGQLRISAATMQLLTPCSLQVGGNIGFYNTTPIAKPTVSGAWAGNTAGKALSTALASLGLITDSTTA